MTLREAYFFFNFSCFRGATFIFFDFGRFGEGLGRVLEGFGEGFGRVLEGFGKLFSKFLTKFEACFNR